MVVFILSGTQYDSCLARLQNYKYLPLNRALINPMMGLHLMVVFILKLNIVSNNFLSSILIECWQLMQKLEYFRLQHVYREVNGFANILVKARCTQQTIETNFVIFVTLLTHVLRAIEFVVQMYIVPMLFHICLAVYFHQ